MKKGLLFLLLLCLVLTGCGSSTALGDRAIVRLLYLNHDGTQYQAQLVVFSSDASAEGEEKIGTVHRCVGTADTIGGAIEAAGEGQQQKPFFAQNEILLIGSGAKSHASEILTWFAGREASRPNLAVFIGDLPPEEKQDKQLVEQLYAMLRHADQSFRYETMLYQIRLDEEGLLEGALPMLEIGENQVETSGLQLFQKGEPLMQLCGEDMKTALMLQNRAISRRLELKEAGEKPFSCVLTHFSRRYVKTPETDNGITLILRGAVRKASLPHSVSRQEKKQLQEKLETLLTREAERVLSCTYGAHRLDLFHLEWHARQQNGTDIASVPFTVKVELEFL